jgi:hypothetical protein
MPDAGDTKRAWGAAPPTLKSHAEALSATFAGKGFVLLVFDVPKEGPGEGSGKGDRGLRCISNVKPSDAALVMRAYADACDRSRNATLGASGKPNYMFGPRVWCDGSSLNRSGSLVQARQMNS